MKDQDTSKTKRFSKFAWNTLVAFFVLVGGVVTVQSAFAPRHDIAVEIVNSVITVLEDETTIEMSISMQNNGTVALENADLHVFFPTQIENVKYHYSTKLGVIRPGGFQSVTTGPKIFDDESLLVTGIDWVVCIESPARFPLTFQRQLFVGQPGGIPMPGISGFNVMSSNYSEVQTDISYLTGSCESSVEKRTVRLYRSDSLARINDI